MDIVSHPLKTILKKHLKKKNTLSQQETPNSVCERAIVELKEAAAVMKEAHFVT